ncbi:MAG: DUF2723 domain-containing protein [Ardenticatenales bacterium]|nr:DUF2723 domain-containing protein [Ardenticatenales bacterium]
MTRTISLIERLLRSPALIVLLFVGTWYWQTMPPGVSSINPMGLDDAAEFQVVGAYWGLEHSPGYPFYTVSANIFVRLVGLLAPGSEPAWRVTLFSLLLSLATLALFYALLRELGVSTLLAASAMLFFGSGQMFWRHAIIAEVYMLSLLLTLLAIWLAWRWEHAARERPYLIGLGLAFGAQAAHHRTGVLVIPFILLWMFLARRDGWRPWLARLLWMAGAGAPMLLFYAYLPIAAWLYKSSQMGRIYRDATQPELFWGMVSSQEWWEIVRPPSTLAEASRAFSRIFAEQRLEMRGIALVLLGALGLVGRDRRLIPLVGLGAGFVYFGASYDVYDVDTMMLPLTAVLVIGLAFLFQRVSSIARDRRELVTSGLALLLLLVSFATLRATAERVDQSGDTAAMEVVEMVRVLAEGGEPIGVLSLQHAPLAAVQYARARYQLENVEPLYPNKLGEDNEAVRASLRARWASGQTIYYTTDIFTIIPDLMPELVEGLQAGRYLSAPTYLETMKLLVPTDTLPRVTQAAQQTISEQAAEGLWLTGYDYQWIERRAGLYLDVTLYWQAENDLVEDYIISLWPQGEMADALEATRYPGFLLGTLPTSALRNGDSLRDGYQLRLNTPRPTDQPFELQVNVQPLNGDPSLSKTVILQMTP